MICFPVTAFALPGREAGPEASAIKFDLSGALVAGDNGDFELTDMASGVVRFYRSIRMN